MEQLKSLVLSMLLNHFLLFDDTVELLYLVSLNNKVNFRVDDYQSLIYENEPFFYGADCH